MRLTSLDRNATEIVHDPIRIIGAYQEMLKSAAKKIDLVFPTINAFFSHHTIGILDLLQNAVKPASVRILMPIPGFNKEILNEIKMHPKLKFKSLDERAPSRGTFAVIDKKFAVVFELESNSKSNLLEGIRCAIFSNSKNMVSFYESIFESLWYQTSLNQKIIEKNKELEIKTKELTQVYKDLRESFESLASSTSKLQSANAQLEAHNKLQAEFINVAAHEMRTPTQAVLGYCEMVSLYPERAQEYVERLKRNAERLHTLISDILDATRIEMGSLKLDPERFNLAATIEEIVNDLKTDAYNRRSEKTGAPTIGPEIKFDFAKPIFVRADKSRIAQVISNLLINAIKFTSRGMVTINLRMNKPATEVTVAIRDTGIGIDADIYPRLFQKFASKSFQGTGLGLFISSGIVQAHGGRIKARNNENGPGATFSFTLPLRPDTKHD